MLALPEFLSDVLLKDSKDTIALYNLATGVRFAKRARETAGGIDELLLLSEREKILTGHVDEDRRRHRVRRDARARRRPGLPGRRRPGLDRHAPPLVVPAGDREG